MSLTAVQITALLLLLTPASLAGKLLTLSGTDKGIAQPVTPTTASEILVSGGLERLGALRLINGPAYTAEIYGSPPPSTRCEGFVFVLPMPANAEASTLLSRPAGAETHDRFFVYRGRIHPHFPSTAVWIERVTRRLAEMVGQPRSAQPVYGISTTASCINARGLAWAQMSGE